MELAAILAGVVMLICGLFTTMAATLNEFFYDEVVTVVLFLVGAVSLFSGLSVIILTLMGRVA